MITVTPRGDFVVVLDDLGAGFLQHLLSREVELDRRNGGGSVVARWANSMLAQFPTIEGPTPTRSDSVPRAVPKLGAAGSSAEPLTVKQVHDALKDAGHEVSERAVTKRCLAGHMGRRHGAAWKVTRAEVDAWITERERRTA